MQLSIVAIKALNYKYNKSNIDYNKYNDNLKIKVLPILEYIYIIDNVSNLVISSLMFKYLQSLDYVESTKCEGNIIKVTLNQKYFNDLENKQEI